MEVTIYPTTSEVVLAQAVDEWRIQEQVIKLCWVDDAPADVCYAMTYFCIGNVMNYGIPSALPTSTNGEYLGLVAGWPTQKGVRVGGLGGREGANLQQKRIFCYGMYFKPIYHMM